ncbi:DUF456 domain-containing protein [Candidatus Acetothermia bacterium]|jgi:uncharacterized protein YqgC (DUF456 family)|nr:DUF456 domain-containing protein [Candidatus Acetothermia bacterium]MCI2427030.1 DUF456 domain-containing protein [Candidatus Acetothermia bacterium]
MMDWLGLLIALIIIFIGFAGLLLPILPGAPLILLGMVVYGLLAGFYELELGFWIGQSILVVLLYAVDYIAATVGVKRYNGSHLAIGGSIVGIAIGLFTLGFIGIIIGPILGAIAGEFLAKGSLERALKGGVGAFVGIAGSIIAKLIIGIVMIIGFLLVVLF